MSMGMLNKIATCCCCYSCACQTACCIDIWHAYEAYGLSNIECGNCCWTICAPICHTCDVGNFGEGLGHCVNCLKYCIYGCALSCCAPIDGCINCVLYIKDICTEGVTGYGNVLKNTRFVSSKLRSAFDFAEGVQPVAKMSEYRP